MTASLMAASPPSTRTWLIARRCRLSATSASSASPSVSSSGTPPAWAKPAASASATSSSRASSAQLQATPASSSAQPSASDDGSVPVAAMRVTDGATAGPGSTVAVRVGPAVPVASMLLPATCR